MRYIAPSTNVFATYHPGKIPGHFTGNTRHQIIRARHIRPPSGQFLHHMRILHDLGTFWSCWRVSRDHQLAGLTCDFGKTELMLHQTQTILIKQLVIQQYVLTFLLQVFNKCGLFFWVVLADRCRILSLSLLWSHIICFNSSGIKCYLSTSLWQDHSRLKRPEKLQLSF